MEQIKVKQKKKMKKKNTKLNGTKKKNTRNVDEKTNLQKIPQNNDEKHGTNVWPFMRAQRREKNQTKRMNYAITMNAHAAFRFDFKPLCIVRMSPMNGIG